MSLEHLLATRSHGAIVTIKRGGRPHLSTVDYHYADSTLRISSTEGRIKIGNLRRDPRASFYTASDDGRSWVAAEGTVTLTPVAKSPDDATVQELIEVYRLIAGEHPDWDEYREAMVADRRLVIRLAVERLYGTA